MGTPLFRQLTRAEFEKLTVEERMDYLQRLMAELREKLEDTRRQLEQSKKTLSE